MDLRRMLRASRVGYTNIVLILPKGRLTLGTRKYLALLDVVFGQWYVNNLTMVITHCEDGSTLDDFMMTNRADPHLGPLLHRISGAVALDDTPRCRILTGTFFCHR